LEATAAPRRALRLVVGDGMPAASPAGPGRSIASTEDRSNPKGFRQTRLRLIRRV
jgi:hypothetical protein